MIDLQGHVRTAKHAPLPLGMSADAGEFQCICYANTLCNRHSALASIEATPASGANHLRNELSRGFIPKKLEVLELTVPPRMFLLSNPVRFI
jgi:hypothetical protein